MGTKFTVDLSRYTTPEHMEDCIELEAKVGELEERFEAEEWAKIDAWFELGLVKQELEETQRRLAEARDDLEIERYLSAHYKDRGPSRE